MRGKVLTIGVCVLVLLLAIDGLCLALPSAVPYDFQGATVKIQHNMSFDRMYANNPEALAHLDWVQKAFNVKLEWTVGARDEAVIEPLVSMATLKNAVLAI